jgi:hydrogenase maturation protease
VAEALVIGYGNDLRTDDAAGRVAAARLSERNLPGVEVVSRSQLTPELADAIAGRGVVVFLDADVAVAEVTLREIVPAADDLARNSHYRDPASLLTLAATVGAPPQRAYVVSIPVHSLCLGVELSPETAALVDQAVELAVGLLPVTG